MPLGRSKNAGIMAQMKTSLKKSVTEDAAVRPIDDPANSLTRRHMLCLSSGCACALAAMHNAPRAHAAWGDPIDVGAIKDYAKDVISEKFVRNNFFVIRNRGRLYAIIATCPHEENYLVINSRNPKEIVCSGHDAVFDPQGVPIGGRVTEGLVRFGISVDDNGHALVDTKKVYPQQQWDDPKSYITLKD